MSAIFLDTETTGIDDPDVIQLAHTLPLGSPASDLGPISVWYFKPTKPITLAAMATHHIIPADLERAPPWQGAQLPPGTQYIVGHSVDFDWKALSEPKVKRICTLALARKYWPSLDSHSLGALIYNLYPHGMARDLLKNAHSADADVDLCGRVFFALYDAMGRPDTWERVWELSEEARVPTRMSFGKYGPADGKPGMLISELKRIDPNYVSWLLNKSDVARDDPYFRKALIGK